MNHCRFLDHLTDCERYFPWWPKGWNQQAATTPVFLPPMEMSWKDVDLQDPAIQAEILRLWTDDLQLHLPFNQFKMHFNPTHVVEHGQNGYISEQWCCLRSAPGYLEMIQHILHPALVPHYFVIKRRWEFRGVREPNAQERAKGLQHAHMAYAMPPEHCEGGMLKKIPSLRGDLPPESAFSYEAWEVIHDILKELNTGTERVLQYIIAFAWVLSHSDSVVLKKEPVAPHKTVRWRMARTTYTIVPRKVAGVMQRGGTEKEVQTGVVAAC